MLTRIALAQYSLHEDSSRNLDKVSELMRKASPLGSQLRILPELCLSPLLPQYAGQNVSRYCVTLDS